MRALGYEMFPFSAFDRSGRIILPDELRIPDHYKEQIGRIATVPFWTEIYKTVSVLDDANFRAFMAGLSYSETSVNVVIFKSMNGVSPTQANNWGNAYNGTIVKTLRQLAGQSHLVDPSILNAINAVIPLIPESTSPGDPSAVQVARPDDPNIPSEDEGAVSSLIPIVLVGLKFLSAILGNVRERTDVLSTVWWYPRNGYYVGAPGAVGWIPLHKEFADGNERTVHGIWNPQIPKSPPVPRFWSGKEIKWRGPWVRDMPHVPVQWCQAFYALARCAPTNLGEATGGSGEEFEQIKLQP
jgi:hypothetical protein